MANSSTIIRSGIEVMKFLGSAVTECDLCGDKAEEGEEDKFFYLWDAVDIPALWDLSIESATWDGATVLTLCHTCDGEEIAKVKELDDDIKGSGTAPTTPANSWSWTDANGVKRTMGAYNVEKCSESHYDKILGPEGYGYLRPTSERGGKAVDNNADYALFFSTGWKDLADPDIEVHNFGVKPDIPVLGEDYRTLWPPIAFIWWKDMGAPNPDVIRYVQWAAAEWKAGKNIQFGCFGGHGRTGTFLSLLLIEAGIQTDGEETIKWVRKNYCKGAIEGLKQEDFIKNYTPGQDPNVAPWG